MTEETFRVGLTADFRAGPNQKGLLDDVLPSTLGGIADLEVVFFEKHLPEVTPPQLQSFDVVVSLLPSFTRRSFRGVGRLVAIGRWGVGYDMIDLEACSEMNVALFITPRALRRPMAESILCLLLALSKDLVWKDCVVREGRWEQRGDRVGVCFPGRTLGSIGFGNVAQELFRLVRPLGFGRLLACTPSGAHALALDLGVEIVGLETVLEESDFLCVNCPLSHATRHLISEEQLRRMKPTSFLVNTARGGIVDTDALVRALRERWIRGAALDVFEEEPLPPDHPLCRAENVILSPHAICRTEEVIQDTGAEVCAGVLELYEGRVPENVVNREVLDQERFQAKLDRLRRRAEARRRAGTSV